MAKETSMPNLERMEVEQRHNTTVDENQSFLREIEELNLDQNTSLDLDLSCVLASVPLLEASFEAVVKSNNEDRSKGLKDGLRGRSKSVITAAGVQANIGGTQSVSCGATQDSTFLFTTQNSTQMESSCFDLNRTKAVALREKRKGVWEERLNILSEALRSIQKGNFEDEKIISLVNEGMDLLGGELKKATQRPSYLRDTINAYAVNVIKLQQFFASKGRKELDEQLCTMLRVALNRWLSSRAHFEAFDRVWLHTRMLFSLMFRHITVVKTLFALKHIISTVFTKTVAHFSEDTDLQHSVYACHQLEDLQNVLTQQLLFIGRDVV